MPSNQKQQQRGLPMRTGKRKTKISVYFEGRYPERKLRRMVRNGASVAMLRAWADNYKTPSGVSGNTALIKISRAFNLNVNQTA